MGASVHRPGLKRDNAATHGGYCAWARAPLPASMGGDRVPDPTAPAMQPDPFLRFQRAAEAAGYPALQIVTMVCLAMVVAAIGLLASSKLPGLSV